MVFRYPEGNPHTEVISNSLTKLLAEEEISAVPCGVSLFESEKDGLRGGKQNCRTTEIIKE